MVACHLTRRINSDRQQRGSFAPVAIAPVWHKATPLLPSGYAQR